MHEFRYRQGGLYCEGLNIAGIVKKNGSPLYIYSHKTLLDHFLKLQSAFNEISPVICYSVKANSNLAILKVLVDHGAGLDIVSGGELYRALKVGCDPRKIVYASVGKTQAEIEQAIRKGILFFNVESLPELENINRVSRRLGKLTAVALRINPDVAPKTHAFITTGKLTNKFGIDFGTTQNILGVAKKFKNVAIKGLHIHIGSQITESAPFIEAINKVSAFIVEQKEKGVPVEYLNIGGGLGIIYNHETPQTAQEYAHKVLPLLKATGLKIILEPGRFIAGQSGILVVKVLYVKKTPLKKFIIVDGGMNDLIRPSLYGAYHQILPLKKSGSTKTEKADVVGPICESGDFFAKDRDLPLVKEGDYLAVMSAGAYGFSMASNYNSRPRPAEVMVKGRKLCQIRRRENYEDIIRGEEYAL